MTNKEKYKLFCETEGNDIPLFQQYWWMEAVCHGKQWDVALAYDGDSVIGVMPYHYGRKYGMTYVIQPQLTQFSGPCYFYPEGLSESKRLDFENEVTTELLREIEKLNPVVYLQNFSPKITNWLPYFWKGYSQTTRYTYRLNDISDTQRLFQNFDSKERQKKIMKFNAVTSARFDMSPTDFATFHKKYYFDKGEKDLLDSEFIERVCSEAINRGNGVIASLHDLDGRLLAARFIVFDSQCAHSLLSALNIGLKHSGYSETLIWNVLQYLSGKVKSYDFEGSMDKGVEYFYRSFGATQTPFFSVSRYRYGFLRRLIH